MYVVMPLLLLTVMGCYLQVTFDPSHWYYSCIAGLMLKCSRNVLISHVMRLIAKVTHNSHMYLHIAYGHIGVNDILTALTSGFLSLLLISKSSGVICLP